MSGRESPWTSQVYILNFPSKLKGKLGFLLIEEEKQQHQNQYYVEPTLIRRK